MLSQLQVTPCCWLVFAACLLQADGRAAAPVSAAWWPVHRHGLRAPCTACPSGKCSGRLPATGAAGRKRCRSCQKREEERRQEEGQKVVHTLSGRVGYFSSLGWGALGASGCRPHAERSVAPCQSVGGYKPSARGVGRRRPRPRRRARLAARQAGSCRLPMPHVAAGVASRLAFLEAVFLQRGERSTTGVRMTVRCVGAGPCCGELRGGACT